MPDLTDFSDFSTFLTPEDKFNMEIDDYLQDFFRHMFTDTMTSDPEFVKRSIEMQELAEKAGIDLQQYIIDGAKESGIINDEEDGTDGDNSSESDE